jgi:hypothetical protein
VIQSLPVVHTPPVLKDEDFPSLLPWEYSTFEEENENRFINIT